MAARKQRKERKREREREREREKERDLLPPTRPHLPPSPKNATEL
jgi:hypothetical protein